jgi:hypothetical protein
MLVIGKSPAILAERARLAAATCFRAQQVAVRTASFISSAGTIIANPLGKEVDDFPGNSYLEAMEDECLAVSAAVERCHPRSTMLKKQK